MTQGMTLIPEPHIVCTDHRATRTVLLVASDPRRRDATSAALHDAGFRIKAVGDDDVARILAREAAPDVVVLDVDRPGLATADVVRQVRLVSTVPLIAVSVGQTETDRIRMLDLGADDVLMGSASPAELTAHVRALLRRTSFGVASATATTKIIRFGACELNLTSNVLRRCGTPVALRPQERKLLEFLAERPGRTFTREQILDAIWGGGGNITIRTVDVHVRWLREKIEDLPSEPRHLLTVRGAGYRFDLEEGGHESAVADVDD